MNGLGREFLNRISVHDHINTLAGVVVAPTVNWTGLVALAIVRKFQSSGN